MIKKVFITLSIVTSLILVQSFRNATSIAISEGHSNVHWYTFGEAVDAQKKNHRIIMVDVYTNWCGPCKMMAAYTFEHPVIAKYLNEHFYPVKFNAETRDTLTFNNYHFVNNNPPGTRRPVHDFALSILDKKMVYPSIVFIDAGVQRLQVISGYFKAPQFEPIIKYFGSGKYKNTNYEDFEKSFVTEIK